jgi:hypothetical protein
MHNNNGNAAPVLVGQPFVITGWSIPVLCNIVCNCLVKEGKPGTPLTIQPAQQVQCPHCEHVYAAFYNAKTNQVNVAMGKMNPVAAEQVKG